MGKLLGLIGGSALPYVLIAVALGGSHWWAFATGVGAEAGRNAKAQLQFERDSAKLLADETAKVTAANEKARELAQTLEIEHAQAQETIDATLAENRRLAAARKLRDPGARSACKNAVPGTTSTSGGIVAETTGGELSAILTEFLNDQAYLADRAANYAQTCYGWVTGQ